MSRIIQLQAENVKRLRAITITPTGNVVILGGANGAGKSSVLDSIIMALGGKDHAAAAPVRSGEESARICLDLGDIIVKRTFTAAGETYLTVQAKDGAKYASPQTMLDKLVGTLTFDPLAFTRMKPKDQLATLKALVGVDFTDLDRERAELYAQRTVAGRSLDQSIVMANAMPHHPDAPDAEVTAAELVAEIQGAQSENAAVDRAEAEIRIQEHSAQMSDTELAKVQMDIIDLEKRLAKLRIVVSDKTAAQEKRRADLATSKAGLESLQRVDLAPLNARLAEVEGTNKKVQANAARKAAMKVNQDKQIALDLISARMHEIDQTKAKVMAGKQFPIDGLGFTESGVILQGLPFEQASSAGQLRASIAIAAAMNPKLRVMVVKDGSLLDANSLALLEEMAAKNDLQIWMERVSTGAECSVIIEDGAIRAPAAVAA